MLKRTSLIYSGLSVVRRNQRYLFWFYALNLLLGLFASSVWSARTIPPDLGAQILASVGLSSADGDTTGALQHSFYSDKLLHGMDLNVLLELFSRPDLAPLQATSMAMNVFGIVFFLASIGLMPGVLLGYSSDHRISRGEFFRACGTNFWRLVRLLLLFLLIAGAVAGLLLAAGFGLADAVDNAANDDRLPILVQFACLVLTILILTIFRAWFDLAQTDVVLGDQAAVRKSLGTSLRGAWQHFGQLLGCYLAITVAAAIVLVAGILLWNKLVPPGNLGGAFLIGQATLLLLLAMRFWQRATMVAFWERQKLEAVA